MSERESCSFDELPADILYDIVSQLPAPRDVVAVESISRRLHAVVNGRRCRLRRERFNLKIFCAPGSDGTVSLEHTRFSTGLTSVQSIATFDFARWHRFEIERIDIVGLQCDDENDNVDDDNDRLELLLDLICDKLNESRQRSVHSLSFIGLRLGQDRFAPSLRRFFHVAMGSCKQVLFRDCLVPAAFMTPDLVAKLGSFDHYRWLDSSPSPPDTVTLSAANDTVISMFAREIRTAAAGDKRSFFAEVNVATADVVCDFIESWLLSCEALYFSLSLHECDTDWKARFFDACKLRGFSPNAYGELLSRKHPHAKIKFNFVEDAQLCRIWPIYEVPDRPLTQTIYYARYFRLH